MDFEFANTIRYYNSSSKVVSLISRLIEVSALIEKIKFSDNLFILRDVLSANECEVLIMRAEEVGFSTAPVITESGFDYRLDIRNNSRIIVDDQALADMLWQRVNPFIAQAYAGLKVTGLNERFRFYRYDLGQRFAI
ncbi:MAG: hypothetical protein AB1489_36275, partial [Acidobacteriota bacterium]